MKTNKVIVISSCALLVFFYSMALYAQNLSTANLYWNDLKFSEHRTEPTLFGVCNEADVLLIIDPDSGVGTEVGSSGLGVAISNEGINFHRDGLLYGLFWNENHSDYRLYTIGVHPSSWTFD